MTDRIKTQQRGPITDTYRIDVANKRSPATCRCVHGHVWPEGGGAAQGACAECVNEWRRIWASGSRASA